MAVADLVPLLVEMALATVADVLPGATVLETEGEMNEDWAFALRIQRVLDARSRVGPVDSARATAPGARLRPPGDVVVTLGSWPSTSS